MNTQNSTTKSFFILSIAGIISKLFSALYVPFLQSIIGADGIGIYSRSYDIFMFAYAITTMGCQPAVTKIVAELRANNNEKDTIRVLKISKRTFGKIGFIMTILIILFAYPYTKLFKIQSSLNAILFLAPSIFLTTILATYRGFFQGHNNMKCIAISQILEQVLNVAISLVFAFIFVKVSISLGSAGGTIGTSIGALLAILYLIKMYYKNKPLYYETNISKRRVKSSTIKRKLFRYSFPIILSAAIQNFGGVIDMMNVNLRLLHAGFSPKISNILYGYLYYYKTLLGVPLIIIAAIGTIILPNISKAYILKDRNIIKKNLDFSFRLTLAITIPSAVGLSVLSNEIYYLLFNGKGATLTLYGSIVLIFMAIAQIQGTVLQGINKFYYMIFSFSIGIVAKILANYILVGFHEINIYGVLIGNFLMYVIPTYLNNRVINKTLKYKTLTFKKIFKPFLSSILMGVILILLKFVFTEIKLYFNLSGIAYWIYTLLYIIILVFIGLIVYLYIMVLIRGIKKSDIESLSPRIYKLLPKFFKRLVK